MISFRFRNFISFFIFPLGRRATHQHGRWFSVDPYPLITLTKKLVKSIGDINDKTMALEKEPQKN